MDRSPPFLAALASAAVPGLDPASVEALPSTTRASSFDVAFVQDAQHRRWVVRAPRSRGRRRRDGPHVRAARACSGAACRSPCRHRRASPRSRRAAARRSTPSCPGTTSTLGSCPPAPASPPSSGGPSRPCTTPTRRLRGGRPADLRRRRLPHPAAQPSSTGPPRPVACPPPARPLGVGPRGRDALAVRPHGHPRRPHRRPGARGVRRRRRRRDREGAGDHRLGGRQGRRPRRRLRRPGRRASPETLETVLEAYSHTRVERPDANLLVRARLVAELGLLSTLMAALTRKATGAVEVLTTHCAGSTTPCTPSEEPDDYRRTSLAPVAAASPPGAVPPALVVDDDDEDDRRGVFGRTAELDGSGAGDDGDRTDARARSATAMRGRARGRRRARDCGRADGRARGRARDDAGPMPSPRPGGPRTSRRSSTSARCVARGHRGRRPGPESSRATAGRRGPTRCDHAQIDLRRRAAPSNCGESRRSPGSSGQTVSPVAAWKKAPRRPCSGTPRSRANATPVGRELQGARAARGPLAGLGPGLPVDDVPARSPSAATRTPRRSGPRTAMPSITVSTRSRSRPACGRPTRWPGSALHQGQVGVVAGVVVRAARQVEDVDEGRLGVVLLDPGVEGRAAARGQRRGGSASGGAGRGEPRRVLGQADQRRGRQVARHEDRDVTRCASLRRSSSSRSSSSSTVGRPRQREPALLRRALAPAARRRPPSGDGDRAPPRLRRPAQPRRWARGSRATAR